MRKIAQIILLAVALGAPAVVALESREASANVAYASPYSIKQTCGTALRLVRVDL